ncbi:formate dehydrogenase subunit gamma [Rubeoparvulum massiliense]|uniref:formate dehydrogenase subunit gamma n=1 Tax=Rubeoparvulum massiliense TaxID=1631346 RepID=UPI00065DE267|nr:cytochrome b/b6 domain-containing protein [Rubeoparvulum massiliense]
MRKRDQKPIITDKKVLRHPRSNRVIHWMTAISIFMLILTGLGQMPIYGRYNVNKLPGGAWLGEYFSTLTVHYLGGIMLLFITIYHVVYHVAQRQLDILPKRGDLKQSYLIIKAMLTKGKEPASDKYLAEQRLAYLYIAIQVFLLMVTGLMKMAKNLHFIKLSETTVFWIAQIHNIATFLLIIGIIAHLGAFIMKANRNLLPGMFTGYIDREYATERHSLWYKRLITKESSPIDGHK